MERNARVILKLDISAAGPMAAVNEKRETPLPASDKTSNFLSAY